MSTTTKRVSETLLDNINIEDLQHVERFLNNLLPNPDQPHFSDDVIATSVTFGELATAIHYVRRTRHVIADALQAE